MKEEEEEEEEEKEEEKEKIGRLDCMKIVSIWLAFLLAGSRLSLLLFNDDDDSNHNNNDDDNNDDDADDDDDDDAELGSNRCPPLRSTDLFEMDVVVGTPQNVPRGSQRYHRIASSNYNRDFQLKHNEFYYANNHRT
uniref:Uncharacterized protein n=1 Tax=Onchocerca volvulus TaxID=6282 RepID=A0A8R1Y3X4_ONCVO